MPLPPDGPEEPKVQAEGDGVLTSLGRADKPEGQPSHDRLEEDVLNAA